jgi:hypothetical protein
MHISARVLAPVAMMLWPAFAQAANLTADEAAKHVGETATVCGTVASGAYAARARNQPTFLNFDKPYPSEVFTAVIWGENRAAFGAPERTLLGKRACVTGVIRLYRGRPEIILSSPSQLTVQ